MPQQPVSFADVSLEGLESSPVASALAGLRADEARCFSTKYRHTFTQGRATAARRKITHSQID